MGTPKRPVSAFSSSISAPLSLAGTNASLPGKIQRTHQSAVEGWSGSSVAISLYIENYSHKIQYCHSTIVTSLWPRSSGSSIFKGWSFRAIWNFSIDFNKFGSPNEYRPRMDGWRERPYLSIKKNTCTWYNCSEIFFSVHSIIHVPTHEKKNFIRFTHPIHPPMSSMTWVSSQSMVFDWLYAKKRKDAPQFFLALWANRITILACDSIHAVFDIPENGISTSGILSKSWTAFRHAARVKEFFSFPNIGGPLECPSGFPMF